MATKSTGYTRLVKALKKQILQSRYQAAQLLNRELLFLYFFTGKSLSDKTKKENWANAVIDNLSPDLQSELPGLRGLSSKNLRNMRQFYESYHSIEFWQSPTAKIDNPLPPLKLTKKFINNVFFWLSFSHHMILRSKCKYLKERIFYMEQAMMYQWSVSTLQHYLSNNLYKSKGRLPNNFKSVLPPSLYTHASGAFKDEHLLDFINVSPEDGERDIENKLVNNIKKFTGKLNFYLTLPDSKAKLPYENNSIGIILCKEKSNAIVEYAFSNIDKAMGVATYKSSKTLPARYQQILPDADALKKILKQRKK